MGIFNRKQTLNAVASGNLLAIEKINDEVFSSKMIGNGFGITHHDGNIFAPCDGVVSDIFPTKHAITITNKKGTPILIHMGIDTVDLHGNPFQIIVSKKQVVHKGDLIAKMDLTMLLAEKKDNVVIVVTPDKKEGELKTTKEQVTPTDTVFTVQ